jgi:hypothetical protein
LTPCSKSTKVSPSHRARSIQENVQTSLAGQDVTLDVAIVAAVNPTGRAPGEPHAPLGIPPGQAELRGRGTLFCVSGPFPDLPIEGILNGVVVGFHGVDGPLLGADPGVWFPPVSGTPGPGPTPRPILLFQ